MKTAKFPQFQQLYKIFELLVNKIDGATLDAKTSKNQKSLLGESLSLTQQMNKLMIHLERDVEDN